MKHIGNIVEVQTELLLEWLSARAIFSAFLEVRKREAKTSEQAPKLGQLLCLSARAIWYAFFGVTSEAKTSEAFTNDANSNLIADRVIEAAFLNVCCNTKIGRRPYNG